MSDTTKQIKSWINENSLENVSNTPDFILAEAVHASLEVVQAAIKRRDEWYGVRLAPGLHPGEICPIYGRVLAALGVSIATHEDNLMAHIEHLKREAGIEHEYKARAEAAEKELALLKKEWNGEDDLVADYGRVLARARPELILVLETELWPNFILQAAALHIPVCVANGRISDRAYPRYRRCAGIFRAVLPAVRLWCVQSALDAERLRFLGARPEAIHPVGNLKFDCAAGAATVAAPAVPRRLRENLWLVCGSTHYPEEAYCARAYRELLPEFPQLRLLIAPRHPQRAASVAEMLSGLSLPPVLYSALRGDDSPSACDTAVVVLDQVGVLAALYAYAALVIIGGTFIAHGGQNPLEAAAWGRPIIYGPHMFNFRDIDRALRQDRAVIAVGGAADLAEELRRLLRDPVVRRDMGERARACLRQHQGAAQRTLAYIKNVLGKADDKTPAR
ncbi:MAG: glycosyltransferase [Candidatus Omnitrophica bacterium]|nr:glycosyltransferase [Candidatus Omnitrophota bacterium]